MTSPQLERCYVTTPYFSHMHGYQAACKQSQEPAVAATWRLERAVVYLGKKDHRTPFQSRSKLRNTYQRTVQLHVLYK